MTLIRSAKFATVAALLLTLPPALAAAQTKDEGKLDAVELNVLLGAVWGNQEEIQLSKLGDRSDNEQVREFAQRMVKEHETALNELQGIAKSHGVELPPPPSATATEQVFKRLGEAEGSDFNKQFMHLQYEAHRIALAAHANAPEVVRDEELDSYAREFAPKIVSHLQDVQNILQQLEKSGS